MKFSPIYLALLMASPSIIAATYSINTVEDLMNKISVLKCGDTVNLNSGQFKDVNFKLSQKCDKTSPIAIKAKEPGSVSMTGNTNIELAGEYTSLEGLHFEKGTRTKRADLITLSGNYNTISNSKFTAIDKADGVWIQLNGTYNNVLNSEFTGKKSLASYINVDVSADEPSYHRVAYNYFSRPLLGSNGGSASRVGHGSMHDFNARVIFEYNLFEQEDGESEIISAKSSENIFRYNTFKNSKGHLSLRQGNRSLVYDNYFLGENKSKQNGLYVRGEDHVIYNNYFSGLTPHKKKTDFGTISFGAATNKPDPKRAKLGVNPYHFPLTKNILFANNTIVNSTSSAITLGSQYSLKDKRNRTRLPESINVINNAVINAPMTVTKIGPINNLKIKGNVYKNAMNEVDGFSHAGQIETVNVTNKELIQIITSGQNDNLAHQITGLKLDLSWNENQNIIQRMKENKNIGFKVPQNSKGEKIKPLTKSDVGVSWRF